MRECRSRPRITREKERENDEAWDDDDETEGVMSAEDVTSLRWCVATVEDDIMITWQVLGRAAKQDG